MTRRYRVSTRIKRNIGVEHTRRGPRELKNNLEGDPGKKYKPSKNMRERKQRDSRDLFAKLDSGYSKRINILKDSANIPLLFDEYQGNVSNRYYGKIIITKQIKVEKDGKIEYEEIEKKLNARIDFSLRLKGRLHLEGKKITEEDLELAHQKVVKTLIGKLS